jgi:hypothetical protein
MRGVVEALARSRSSRKLWLSRAFFAADLLAGIVRGSRCPSCGSRRADPLRSPGRSLQITRSCRDCGVFFRPTGLQRGRIPELYYSLVYEAGLATSDEAVSHLDLRSRLSSQEGKRRSELVHALFGPPQAGEIVVFGCSWGYEVSELIGAGYAAFGIELSEKRRGWGRSRLGLPIYESAGAAAADGRSPSLVLSSHVLEHIPEVEAVLDELQRWLRPTWHLHITPFVDDYRTNAARAHTIGREHPLGISTAFWRHWCSKHGYSFQTSPGDRLVGAADWELVTRIDASRSAANPAGR